MTTEITILACVAYIAWMVWMVVDLWLGHRRVTKVQRTRQTQLDDIHRRARSTSHEERQQAAHDFGEWCRRGPYQA